MVLGASRDSGQFNFTWPKQRVHQQIASEFFPQSPLPHAYATQQVCCVSLHPCVWHTGSYSLRVFRGIRWTP